MPKVSVLMPTYKTNPQHLREAIDSILAQTFTDFEFLILDDCPSDKSVEKIIKTYSDPRIKYARNEHNMGISGARNKLIDMAQGEYLAVMDHDDISLPRRFAKEVEFLDKHPEVGVVSTRFNSFPDETKNNKNPLTDHEIKLALMRTCAMIHPASMIRKSVLINNNIRYETEYSPSEDYALFCRLIKYTQFRNLPEILFKYRKHRTNTSKLHMDEMVDASHRIHAFVKRENPELFQEFLTKATHTNRFCLFDGIPLLTYVTHNEDSRALLFDFIPVFRTHSDNKRTLVSIFGIPFLSIFTSEYKVRVLLFGILPILCYKNQIKLR